MGFVKQAAKGGLFGLAGMAASSLFKDKKKKDSNSSPSLLAKDTTGVSTPSLINSKSLY